MSTASQDRVVNHNGSVYRIYSRAWWLDGAAETPDGRVAVARISAVSTTLRHPSQNELAADPVLNPYYACPEYHGEPARYMLSLTEAELDRLGITPGRLVFPQIVDAPRPHTNVTVKPVSFRRQQQSMDWLQSDCIGTPSDY